MVLLDLLISIKSSLKIDVRVVHFHHQSREPVQKAFQDKACALVQKFCLLKAIPFYQKKGDSKTRKPSEESLRVLRYRGLFDTLKVSESHYLVLAHHAQDLMETRLMRLLRGVGNQGLTSMRQKDSRLILRPLLSVNRSQILSYAKMKNLKWAEDPSNLSPHTGLRNWIRNKWLSDLEHRYPGSIHSLSRSLNHLTANQKKNNERAMYFYQKLVSSKNLDREGFMLLPVAEKQLLLAYLFKTRGFKNFSQNHIKEIIKRLQTPRKEFTFTLLGKTWIISKKTISFP